jgi:hypothetical protein
MGRKRRVPRSNLEKEPHKWGRPAGIFLQGLAECFGQCTDDISNYNLLMAIEARRLRGGSPPVPRSEAEQARINQGVEYACEWAALTVFRAAEDLLGTQKAR